MKSATLAISSALLLTMACGGNNGASNNGASNNGASNNGASNNGASNNGASNNGASNNGASNNGASNNGASNNGASNNGASNNGASNNGTTTTNNGSTNATNNGTMAGGSYFRFDLDGTAVELNPGATFIEPQSYGISGADVNFMYSMSFGLITMGPGSFECGGAPGVTNFTFVESGTAYQRRENGTCGVELTTATGSGGRVEGTFKATLFDEGGNMVTITNGEFAADVE